MAATDTRVFLRRAEDFSRGMGFFRDDVAFAQSAALLAIHSAIAYADALRSGLGDGNLSDDDHQVAAKGLERAVQALSKEEDVSGVARFRKLIAQKSAVAYGSKRMDTDKLRVICVDSERFALWANKIGNVRVAGWRVEDD